MTLPRFETGSARTYPTIPGRYPHTKRPDVAVLQPELAVMCPTILERRLYTKLLDVTVLQPEQAVCALQYKSVAATPSFSMSRCYSLNKQNVPYNSRASPLHQASRCHSVTTLTSNMCPAIQERRLYTKLLDVSVTT